MTPDEQEALSIRYAHFVRLVPLSSGRWAYFAGNRLYLSDNLDPGVARMVFEVSKRQTFDQPKPKHSIPDLLKDLGL